MFTGKVMILNVLYKFLFLFSTYDAAQISDPAWSAIAAHPAWKLLDKYDCGYSVADRIIGGTNAALGQFPWIARLGYISPEERMTEWLCGGTLITPSVVVTAAHCSRNSDYELKLVRLGEYDVRTDPDCQLDVCAPPVQDRNVSKIVINPGFLATGFHNDIAMLELATPVVLNDYVSVICLPRKNIDVDLRFGEPLTVAGWGTTNLTTQERANILQVVQVPLVAPETCDTFGKSFKISAGELCAGAVTNRDACGGDSGGPLMKVYDTPDGPKVYLVGVVSFGPTVCGIKKPGVYTSTSHYIKYILDGVK